MKCCKTCKFSKLILTGSKYCTLLKIWKDELFLCSLYEEREIK